MKKKNRENNGKIISTTEIDMLE